MADVDLIHWTLETLAANWIDDNADFPVLIHKDDSQRYERSETGGTAVGDSIGVNEGEISNNFDLSKDNAITVGSSPDRLTSPIGTEYDLDVEDGVSVLVEGVHESEWGHVADGQQFRALVDEVQRALLVDRNWPLRNVNGDEHYHTLRIENETNRSSENKDYYATQFDVLFDGYEELP